MAEKPLTLTRWWYLPPLLTLVISGAGSFFFAILPRWLFNAFLIIGFLLLLCQLVLLLSALIQRKWWHALGIFLGSIVSIVLLCLNLVILFICTGMDNAHSPEPVEQIDSLEVQPTDTLDIISNDSI